MVGCELAGTVHQCSPWCGLQPDSLTACTALQMQVPVAHYTCLISSPFHPRSVGLLYHLYNQFAFNTLARVSPVSHGVCNVVKRVAIIATSGERLLCAAVLMMGCGGLGSMWSSAWPSFPPTCAVASQLVIATLPQGRAPLAAKAGIPHPPSPALRCPRPAVLFFGNKLTTQTQIGTAVALIGTWLYTEASKKKPAPKAA